MQDCSLDLIFFLIMDRPCFSGGGGGVGAVLQLKPDSIFETKRKQLFLFSFLFYFIFFFYFFFFFFFFFFDFGKYSTLSIEAIIYCSDIIYNNC